MSSTTSPTTPPPETSSALSDPFATGPSVYLYGFLATLVLIFLVSLGVAWKGFHTRRMLRARIDEAIARGVLMPGYDASDTHLPLSRRPLPPRPLMHEMWIGQTDLEKQWDIKPTSLTALKPFVPEPQIQPPPSMKSRMSHWLDPLRQYWFVTPPDGTHANQLQGRPARVERVDSRTQDVPEPQTKNDLDDVEEVQASVVIAMPQARSTSRPNSYVPVASSSRPTSSVPVQEQKELPPLVIGVVQVPMVEDRRTGKEKAAS